MSELEFDILDELYFIQSFEYIQKIIQIEEQILKKNLHNLFIKGWIKCFSSVSKEIILEKEFNFEADYKNYYYLATKQGLIAHNSR